MFGLIRFHQFKINNIVLTFLDKKAEDYNPIFQNQKDHQF